MVGWASVTVASLASRRRAFDQYARHRRNPLSFFLFLSLTYYYLFSLSFYAYIHHFTHFNPLTLSLFVLSFYLLCNPIRQSRHIHNYPSDNLTITITITTTSSLYISISLFYSSIYLCSLYDYALLSLRNKETTSCKMIGKHTLKLLG